MNRYIDGSEPALVVTIYDGGFMRFAQDDLVPDNPPKRPPSWHLPADRLK